MMRKGLWIFILLSLAVLLSACAFDPVPQPDQPVAVIPTVQPEDTAVEKVATLVPDDGQSTVAQTPKPVIDEKTQETVAANLRTLLGVPEVTLALKGPDRSPNATNQPAILFVDAQGNNYYINPDTLQPIEFTLAQPFQATGTIKTADELRAIAEELAQKQSTHFGGLKNRLTYSEGIKGENNFFRWEMPGTDMGGMPAIMQIGLKQDGSLFSYLNSIDFLPAPNP